MLCSLSESSTMGEKLSLKYEKKQLQNSQAEMRFLPTIFQARIIHVIHVSLIIKLPAHILSRNEIHLIYQ